MKQLVGPRVYILNVQNCAIPKLVFFFFFFFFMKSPSENKLSRGYNSWHLYLKQARQMGLAICFLQGLCMRQCVYHSVSNMRSNQPQPQAASHEYSFTNCPLSMKAL